MSDGAVKPENASRDHAKSSAAFRQAMTGVKTWCVQVVTSIDNHDFESVEHTARNAANLWLTGRIACRRLIERSKAFSPYADAARRLLEANYMTLMELFERATRTIDVPKMRRALRDLRGTLISAMAHPLSDLTVGTPAGDQSKRT